MDLVMKKEDFRLKGHIINLGNETFTVEDNTILPTLRLSIERTSIPEGSESKDLLILHPVLRLALIHEYGHVYISNVHSRQQLYIWKSQEKTRIDFNIPLDDHSIYEIERIRRGNDIHFYYEVTFLSYSRSQIDEPPEEIQLYSEFNIPKSIWSSTIMPKIDKKHLTIIAIPSIVFPEIEIKKYIIQNLDNARVAYDEGRYSDVFSECRKALGSIYVGMENWCKNNLTVEEKTKSSEIKSDKTNFLRNLSVTKLVGHEEKSTRINNLRNAIFQFTSLSPHSPDYPDMVFNQADANLALNITSSFISNLAFYLKERIPKND